LFYMATANLPRSIQLKLPQVATTQQACQFEKKRDMA